MDLLEQLLARAQMPAGPMDVPADIGADQYETQPGAIPGSLLDQFTRKKKQTAFPKIDASLQAFGPQAGLLAPGIGQLGNMNPAISTAPVGPTDPNYAPPADTSDSLMALVRPEGGRAPSVPMPRARPREADGSLSPDIPRDISMDARGPAAEEEEAAGPTPGAPAQQQGAPLAAPQMANPSLWDNVGGLANRFMQGLSDHSATLLALGAGFAGAPNIGQGISRAAQYAIPASQQDLKNRMALQNQAQSYRAMVEAGVPQQQALAAIGNPELQKRLLDSYITDRKMDIKTVKSKNAWGEETEQLVAVNPYDPTKAINLSTGQAAPAGASQGGVAAAPGSSFYAKGVSDQNFDPTKSGEDYMAQFSPEIQQAAKDYLAGRTSQTGRQLPQQRIKMIAQKYGSDIGMPADDAAIGQRKQWANSLGNTQSGVGLQVKGLQQGLEHFAKLSDALVKLKLSNGGGWETGANWINWLKSQSTEQQDLIHHAQFVGQGLAGEMGNLFSKNGGGVHERAKTADLVSNAFMSSKSAAGSLDGLIEMIDGGLNTLEQRRDELFPNPADRPRGSNFMGPKQEEALAKIKHNVSILRGEATPTAAPSTGAVAPSPGRYVWDPATGKMKPLQ